MPKFHVYLHEIRAALLFASKNDDRYAINGVHFDVKAGHSPLLMSTDGARAAIIESVAPQDDDIAPCEFTVSAAELKAVCGYFKPHSKDILPLCVDYHPSSRVVFTAMGHTVDVEDGAVIDAGFPNLHAVLPGGEKEPVPALAVNGELVADFAKAAKCFKADPVLSLNLYSASKAMDVRISGAPQFYGIIMPAKMNEEPEWQPTFLQALGITEKKAA